MFLRTLTVATVLAAVALAIAAPAHADPAADCRGAAAALWPGTQDAFDNEMRQQAQTACMNRLPPTVERCTAFVGKLSAVQLIGPSGQAPREAFNACMKGRAWTG